jgi:hypothetical protein
MPVVIACYCKFAAIHNLIMVVELRLLGVQSQLLLSDTDRHVGAV